jgi:hypothetical protein
MAAGRRKTLYKYDFNCISSLNRILHIILLVYVVCLCLCWDVKAARYSEKNPVCVHFELKKFLGGNALRLCVCVQLRFSLNTGPSATNDTLKW